MKKKVVVICGGRSAEHEVSIISAASVIQCLDKSRYDVVALGIGKNGETFSRDRLLDAIPGEFPEVEFPEVKDWMMYLRELDSEETVVFPVLHGPYGEDGTVQGLLELLNLPYVGAGVGGSAVGMNKIHSKSILRDQGIPVLPAVSFDSAEWRRDSQSILERIKTEMDFPLFVKPVNMGSSIGICRCEQNSELREGIDKAFRYDDIVLVETGVDAREIEVSVLGNMNPEASCPGEIIPSDVFYSYAAKYLDESSELIIPADLPKEISKKLKETACQVFRILHLEGMARIDFLLEKESLNFWLNEPNTIPGFTPISMYPKLWSASGLEYSQLLERLIELGIERFKRRSRLSVDR